MTIKPTSVPTKRLNKTISSTATSFSLVDITGWDSNDLTSSDFGSILYAVFRNSTDTIMEIMEIDATTIADSNITINKRGLKFDGDLTTEVVANKLSWIRGDTIVEIGTDAPQLFNSYVDLYSTQTITGMKSVSTPTTSEHIANMQYVLDIAAGVPVSFDRTTVAGTAGETITTGQAVYFDTVTNNKWMLADASTVAKVENVLIGIAQGAGTNGTAISGGIVLFGLDSNQSGMTTGDIMYISDTAGTISSTPGTKEVTIGIAKSATDIYFNPRFNQELTEDEQDALVGTQGQPSSTNKYVTDDNVYSDEFDQTQTTQDALVSFGEDDATTKKNLIAQSFKPSRTKISGVKLDKQTDTGTFTGTVTVSIQSDTSGKPDGTDLATKTLTNAEWLLLLTGEFEIEFSSEYDSLVEGDSYWIVATSSTSDTSNHPNLGTNSVGGYSDGSTMYKNATDDWVAIANIDLYFKTINGLNNQIIKVINGKIDKSITDKIVLPFMQEIPGVVVSSGSTSNLYSDFYSCVSDVSGDTLFATNHFYDGSQYFCHILRYEKDLNTGMYFYTNNVLIGSSSVYLTYDAYSCTVLGDYIYVGIYYTNTLKRYDKADLSNVVEMTFSGTPAYLQLYNDGIYIYIGTGTTWYRYSVSGTILTNEEEITDSTLTGYTFLFDGTFIYSITDTSIIKNSIRGKLLSSISILTGGYDSSNGRIFGLSNINDSILYVILIRDNYSLSGSRNIKTGVLMPITKPV